MVLILVVLGSSRSVAESLSPGLAVAWSLVVLAAVVGVIILLVRRGKRVMGGQQQYVLIKEALKTGDVPAGADRERWRAALRRMADDRSGRWFYLFFGAFILVVNVSGYVSLRDRMSVGWTLAFAALVLFVLAGYVLLPAWLTRRRARQARVLLAQLEEPESGTEP